ncbi:MAG: hypothetical protein Ct9H300mP25_02120 [Acidobacteriota bacterium]|nr:MAG: hypothetical protein Ct9H300mP25_02120 [Acidobacteriota bacterium]
MIDTTVHEVVHTIQLTGEMVRPMGVVVSPDSSVVYVTTGRGRSVIAIDAVTYEPVASVEVGKTLRGVSRLLVTDGISTRQKVRRMTSACRHGVNECCRHGARWRETLGCGNY